jgi:hypothetical protein
MTEQKQVEQHDEELLTLGLIIAKVAHQVNKSFCESIGDTSQVDWDDAPDWQKESVINGVGFNLANPKAKPEDTHKNWMAQKTADGWVYGKVKDPELKMHPCMVPYNQLPVEQRSKDHIFKAVVLELGAVFGLVTQ